MNSAVEYHSRIASGWESNYSRDVFSIRERILEEMLAGCDLRGQRWLDAGCGTGTLARFLAKRKRCRVLGVDASGEMIARCAAAPDTEFRVVRDICETALPDSEFDGVVCSSVLEYLAEPEKALHEFYRVLRRGGVLLVSVPNANPLARWPVLAAYTLTRYVGRRRWCEYLDHSEHCYSRSEFKAVLRKLRFLVDDVRTWGNVRGSSPILGQGTLLMFRGVKR